MRSKPDLDRWKVSREAGLDGLKAAALQVERAKPVNGALDHRAGDLSFGEERVSGHAETPLRPSEVGLHRGNRFNRSLPPPVEVPPATAVGDEIEQTKRRPGRLEDRFVLASRQLPGDPQTSILSDLRQPQLAAVPGQVGMVPAQPGEVGTVRA